MNRTVAIVLLILVVAAGGVVFSKSKSASSKKKSTAFQERTSFCEDDFDDNRPNPDPLPSPVLSALMKTKEAREATALARAEGETLNPSKLFTGTRVHLSDSSDVFFLVIGKSPASGADNSWFWIVRQSRQKTSILLWLGANCIDIGAHKTSGLRDIQTSWSSASETRTAMYSYNGKVYELKGTKWGPAKGR